MMRAASPFSIRLPYGVDDVDPKVRPISTPERQVRCYVRGCRHFVRVPRRGIRGDICPDHKIYCHWGVGRPTYSYTAARRNVIASPRLFEERIVGHPYKFESHRLGNENSEDALSWNVFRSLQEAGRLGALAEALIGQRSPVEPRLYMWGIELTDDSFLPWELLDVARERFESSLPVQRPKTEPDIALHLPGRYLILIEAKFTSANPSYERGPRRDGHSLTFDELLGIYNATGQKILNLLAAQASPRVHYQLWRNMVFAEHMAGDDHPATKAYHVNLVREDNDLVSAHEFARLMNRGYEERFRQVTWEWIHRVTQGEGRLRLLHRYLETKTTGLRKAFQL